MLEPLGAGEDGNGGRDGESGELAGHSADGLRWGDEEENVRRETIPHIAGGEDGIGECHPGEMAFVFAALAKLCNLVRIVAPEIDPHAAARVEDGKRGAPAARAQDGDDGAGHAAVWGGGAWGGLSSGVLGFLTKRFSVPLIRRTIFERWRQTARMQAATAK